MSAQSDLGAECEGIFDVDVEMGAELRYLRLYTVVELICIDAWQHTGVGSRKCITLAAMFWSNRRAYFRTERYTALLIGSVPRVICSGTRQLLRFRVQTPSIRCYLEEVACSSTRGGLFDLRKHPSQAFTNYFSQDLKIFDFRILIKTSRRVDCRGQQHSSDYKRVHIEFELPSRHEAILQV